MSAVPPTGTVIVVTSATRSGKPSSMVPGGQCRERRLDRGRSTRAAVETSRCCRRAAVTRLLRIGLKRSQQADRPLLRLTTIRIARPSRAAAAVEEAEAWDASWCGVGSAISCASSHKARGSRRGVRDHPVGPRLDGAKPLAALHLQMKASAPTAASLSRRTTSSTATLRRPTVLRSASVAAASPSGRLPGSTTANTVISLRRDCCAVQTVGRYRKGRPMKIDGSYPAT